MRDGRVIEGFDQNRAVIADSMAWCPPHCLPICRRLPVW
jgi:hypothetical protein